MPIARRASELAPSDASLRCNLALVLLLTGSVDSARDEIRAARAMDPSDQIATLLSKIIDEVNNGRRAQPRSLAELEGRAR